MKTLRYAIGIMTGTSLDGIDAALVQIEGHGLQMKVMDIRHGSKPLGPAADVLRQLSSGEPLSASRWAHAGLELSRSCLEVAQEVAGDIQPDLVAVHGQTIHHAPPYSIQWIDPTIIAHGMACPVIHDLRGGDLAAGGQGAPITPLADWIMFRRPEPVTVINLGGFCNVTHLPSDTTEQHSIERIQASDICPCNHLLDLAARKLLGRSFDDGGSTASVGRCQEEIAQKLLAVLSDTTSSDRSLGSGDEGHEILDPLWKIDEPADALATLTEVIARRILASVPETQKHLLLAGGGARNKSLVDSVIQMSGVPVEYTGAFGVDIQAREAAAMAILGTLAMDGIPITLPAVTQSSEPTTIDGSWCLPRQWWRSQIT